MGRESGEGFQLGGAPDDSEQVRPDARRRKRGDVVRSPGLPEDDVDESAVLSAGELAERDNATLDSAIVPTEAEASSTAHESTESNPSLETTPLTPVEETRAAYAQAIRNRSKILFGRTSKADLGQRRQEYQAAISDEVRKKIEEFKAEFGGTIPTDPALEAQLNAQITELILSNKAEEENALMVSMKESADNSAMQRFQKFWQKHSNARLLLGIGLTGGVIGATLTGQFAVAAGLQGLRVPLSGAGGTLLVESSWDKLRSKFGKTGEIKSDEEIDGLSDQELEQRLAAHETSFVDTDSKEFGVKVRGVKKFGIGKQREDRTGQRLMKEYQARQKEGVQVLVMELRGQGMTPDQIVDQVLDFSLSEQGSHHTALEQRRASDRRSVIGKWTTAALGGAALAAFSGLGALRQAGQAVEGMQDSTKTAATTTGRVIRAINQARFGGMADSSHAAADTAQAAAVDTAHVAVPDSADTPAYGDGQVEETPKTYHADQGDGAKTGKSWSGLDRPVRFDVNKAAEGFGSAAAPDTAQADSIFATAAADSTRVVVPETSSVDTSQVESAAKPETAAGAAATATAAEAAEAKEAGTEIVKKGDNLWKILERHLHDKMGDKFDGLDEARKTYMIDALKDRVVEHHDQFGLDNPDQLQVGQKLDLSSIFEGKDASDLGQIHDQAVALDQSAVDNITHNNEILREWVQAHPHEALHADQVLAQARNAAEHVASTDGPILSVQAREIWVKDLTEGMRERMLCDLSEQYPAEYAAAHAENPDMYPNVATEPVETTATAPETETHIHLDHDAIAAQKKLAKTTAEFYRATLRPDADAILKNVNDMTAGEILKKGFLEHRIDEMEGGTRDWAKKLASAFRKLLKEIPSNEYHKAEKLKDILGRVQEVKGK